MRWPLKTASFILIFIGTVGLLLNELSDWGRTATIALAATNLVGFASLGRLTSRCHGYTIDDWSDEGQRYLIAR